MLNNFYDVKELQKHQSQLSQTSPLHLPPRPSPIIHLGGSSKSSMRPHGISSEAGEREIADEEDEDEVLSGEETSRTARHSGRLPSGRMGTRQSKRRGAVSSSGHPAATASASKRTSRRRL